MTLTGYPAEDLVLRESFARASEHALVDLAAELADRAWASSPSSSATWRTPRAAARRRSTRRRPTTTAPATPTRAAAPRATPPRCCYGGEVVARYYKRHLPNYGVFDEARYFVPGNELPSCACTASTSR